MQDTTLLQMITDGMVPTRQLLELLQAESLVLHGRDMGEMEHILAQKQALVILLEQHGRRRSQLLAGLGLPANRKGLQELASQSDVGEQLLAASDELSALIAECQAINEQNGSLIQLQQVTTAHQLRILNGVDTPTLYDSRGSTAGRARPRPLSQA
ncbi:flagellar synthesis chaperone protein FlgN [Pseudomonas cichorii]|uniref:Flagellar protein FlgN n=1 Tax=Pseudomonas serbiensis TaxID=3064350 RepID=A0ABT9CLW0_9PSED|nr:MULTISPECIES: flagellar protein FlgN [Pseudomonas]MDO7926395.1 flagellar protein FlgN [Pseudomonas sp. KFB-138]GFM82805.1 flagellar synthesis chaperone protein FlgN [Pseudomonas cichorii]GFM86687.1 flagellar synthesis chaperone protein FlgN [Pseudomonas cichorii]